MFANQLPENMGKKIVEALKKQAVYEEENTSFESILKETETDSEVQPETEQITNDEPVEKITPVEQEAEISVPVAEEVKPIEQTFDTTKFDNFPKESLSAEAQFLNSMGQPTEETFTLQTPPPLHFSIPEPTPIKNAVYNSYSSELPTNVAVLMKLIAQLPAGVSKQIGAQIIRQTIEALGISMNSVLQEAQQVQESLSSSATECTIKVQEYKNQILQLETNMRDYQRQMTQINDLISLFILTDNK